MIRTVILAVLLLWIAGCTREAETGSPPPDSGQVRVIHASPDAGAFDVELDGYDKEIAFTQATTYVRVSTGPADIRIYRAGEKENPIVDERLDINPGQSYTFITVGLPGNIRPLVLTDSLRAPRGDMAKVRFVHTVPDGPAFDLTAPGANRGFFAHTAFTDATDYIEIQSGIYELALTPAGRPGVTVFDAPNAEFRAGGIYTIMAQGRVVDNSITLNIYRDNQHQ